MRVLKSLLCVLFCLFLTSQISFGQGAAPTFAQPNYKPTPFTLAGQLLNLKNAYAYGVTPGALLDTMSSTTKYLNIAIESPAGTAWVAPDTFGVYPVYGTGKITFDLNVNTISGTPVGTVFLQESVNGILWSPCIAGSYTDLADTLVAAGGLMKYSFTREKIAPYYRIGITVTGTQSITIQSYYFIQYPNYIANK